MRKRTKKQPAKLTPEQSEACARALATFALSLSPETVRFVQEQAEQRKKHKRDETSDWDAWNNPPRS